MPSQFEICFNFNAQGISSLNYRTFQVMSCERIMLSDDRIEGHKLFTPNEDIVIYKDMSDLKQKINLYLNDENLYKITAQKARESIVKNHSAKLSVQSMLNKL